MRSRIKPANKRATASSTRTSSKKTKSPDSKKGGFGLGSDRNDYYQNDQDRYDYSSSRMGMRSDRDSDFDYEAEDRSYRGAGRQQEDYYADRERGLSDEGERNYSMQRRNRQLDEDVYGSRERDEDYNDRNFLGTRGSGRSNYRGSERLRDSEVNNRSGGGGDLYRDLDRDRQAMDDDRYERMNWGADSYGTSRTRDDDYRTRDEYHDREEIRARGSSFGRDDFRSQDEEGYRNDYRTRDNLSGLSGGYGRNSTRESIRSERSGRGGGGGRNR